MLKIRAICHAWDLWKSAWSHKQFIYYAHQTCEIYLPGTAFLNGFQSSGEFLNPMSQTVLSKYSFIWNNAPVNIWNDLKAQK